MPHFVMIDHHSGFVWGEVDAGDHETACRLLDESLGQTGLDYHEVSRSRLAANASAYHVYLAPLDWRPVGDGQDPAEIARVEALEYMTAVEITEAPEPEDDA
jgi:hypothetical protein